MIQRPCLAGLVLLAALLSAGPACGDEVDEELARSIESLYAFGVRGLPAAYADDAQPAERRQAIALGLAWLTAHQAPDGSWKPHELFWCHGKQTPAEAVATGTGKAVFDVGLTGMSVSAYLGAGYTHRGTEPEAKVVRTALAWLVAQQDAEGCVGARRTSLFLYNHAFATLALVEAYALSGDSKLRAAAQKAIDFSAQARNPGAGWRYGVRPGDNDTSLTGCMGLPLYAALRLNRAAEQAGLLEPLNLDAEIFAGIRSWVDAITDPDYGRAGYTVRGTGPARPLEYVDRFPGEKSEACTAITVFMRQVLPRPGESKADARLNQTLIDKGVGLMLDLRPSWSPQSGSLDLYYWYYATMALRGVGGRFWREWDEALTHALLAGQCRTGEVCGAFGSWEPISIWAMSDGGRIYATAISLLMLETPDRMHPLPSDRSDLVEAVVYEGLPPERRASILRGIAALHVQRGAGAAADLLPHESPAVRAAAAEALGQLELDSAQVQALAELLEDGDRTVRLAAIHALASQRARTKSILTRLGTCLDDPEVEVAAAAARALGGSGAAAAAEVLRPRMLSGALELRVAAAAAVHQLSGESLGALPILLEGLAAPSERVRLNAARALEEMKPTDAKAEEALLQALQDKSPDVRLHAAGALFALGLAKEACVDAWVSVLAAADARTRLQAMERLEAAPSAMATPQLAAQLLRGSAVLRIQAARTLGATATGARPAAAALAWCSKNGSSALREAATQALAALELDVAAARAHLIPILMAKEGESQDRRLLQGASLALIQIGQPIVPALIAELRLGSYAVKRWTLYIFSELGPQAAAAVRDIAAVMGAGDDKVKFAAAVTLGRIGQPADKALPELKDLLSSPDARLSITAIEAIARIAAGSDAAFALLQEVAQRSEEKDKQLRNAAIAGMGLLGTRGEQAIPFLFTLLEGSDLSARSTAVNALAQLWPLPERQIADALGDGSARVRRCAAEVVALVGPDAEKMVRPLIKVLAGGSFGVDTTYGDALGAIGKPAVSALTKLLGSKHAAVRREAARALGLIGPDASRALSRLKKLLRDTDPGVVFRAQVAIKSIEAG